MFGTATRLTKNNLSKILISSTANESVSRKKPPSPTLKKKVFGRLLFPFYAKNQKKEKNGKILSTDWGICQMNDYWYIGKNRPIATIREAIENPEKCVRIMIKRYKEGGLRDWVCYLK